MNTATPLPLESPDVSPPAKPKKPLVIPLVIFALCTAFGIAAGVAFGFFLSALSPELYESSATIHIEPRLNQPGLAAEIAEKAPEQNVQHQFHIHSELIVERCLAENSLYHLRSLEEFEKGEATQLVLQNLSVDQNPKDKSIFIVSYRSSDPRDSRTILANLLNTYQEYLEDKYRNDNDQFIHMLRELNENFQRNYADLVEQIASIKRQSDLSQEERDQRLEDLERQRQQVGEMLHNNHEKLAEASLTREYTGFTFTHLQQPDLGTKSGTSLWIFMLYGITAGVISCGTVGLVVALIVRSAFSS